MANKIIQIVQHLRAGGLEVMALELARAASNQREMYIVSLEDDKETALKNWPRLQEFADNLIFLNKPQATSIKTLFKLWALFIKHRPQAVHTHHLGPLFYGGIAARFAMVKHLIHTEHDAWHLENPNARKLESKLLKFLKPTLVADSSAVRNNLRNIWSDLDIKTIANGVDIEKFSPGDKKAARLGFNLPEETFIIGCAGRLEEVKNHKILLEAFAMQVPIYHLAIAGDGSLRQELEQQAADLGIWNQVHFLGQIDDMTQFYRAIDMFCLPSLNEGLPLSILEAQSVGVPVIASDVGACAEAICVKTGGVFKPDNSDGLAQIIGKYALHEFTASPREFICEKFSLTQMAQRYLALCR